MNSGLSVTLVASMVLLAVILNVSPQLSNELNQTNDIVRDVIHYGIRGFDNVTMGYSVTGDNHIEDELSNLTREYNGTLKYVKNRFGNITLPTTFSDMTCTVINVSMNGSTITMKGHPIKDKVAIRRITMLARTHKNIIITNHRSGEIIGVVWNGTSGKIAYCRSIGGSH